VLSAVRVPFLKIAHRFIIFLRLIRSTSMGEMHEEENLVYFLALSNSTLDIYFFAVFVCRPQITMDKCHT
jgi:hypothetical protein